MGSVAELPHRAKRRCPVCGERFPLDFTLCPRDGSPLGDRTPHADPLVGVVLAGTYRITRLLARGGMGRLYEAEHTRLPRRVAVKVIHDTYARNEDAVARFEREARAAASIQSNHVVAVHDIARSPDDRPCIVADRLDGEDLQARLDREGTLPVAQALAVARELCRGLSAAHACGVVHRDLKPSNVFLATGAGGTVTVKILDFGVAKLAGAPDITNTGAVLGTPAYMAPEQARGATAVDERADVYGVGAVLYRMLTGHSPHEAVDATASLARLLHGRPERLRDAAPTVPASVAAVVERAMARDARDRIRDVATLERGLAAVAPADEPIDLTPSVESLRQSGEHTLVLPRGAVELRDDAQRARNRVRPRSLAFAALTVAASAGLAASLTAALCRAFAVTESTIATSAAILAAVAAIGVGWMLARRFAGHLRDLPHLSDLGRRLRRAALVAAVSLGALELVRGAVAAVDAGGAPASAPLTALVLAATAIAGLLAYALPRP